MLKQKLWLWLLLSLTLLFFLWFMQQQSPQLPLGGTTGNLSSSTFYQVTVSNYAASDTAEAQSTINDTLIFSENNQEADLENRLFLPLQQQARVQKLHLDAEPAAAFSALHWQWQGFEVTAQAGFSEKNQIILEQVTIKNNLLELTLPQLTIDIAETFAQSSGEIHWQQNLSYGQAQALTYQDQRLFLYQVESFIYPSFQTE